MAKDSTDKKVKPKLGSTPLKKEPVKVNKPAKAKTKAK